MSPNGTSPVPGSASSGPGSWPKPSGLREAMRVLKKVEGIGICELTNADVVRHVMVQRIVKAYEEYETAKNGGKGKK